ncbi:MULTISPECIES: T6SS immunity protein Tli4 family protein [Pseudomonas]|uniref:T6SS immunity protein Tli4 family protein n=3 Tax=Pseudomonas TaxID=286 RepID=A0ABT5RGK5_9PSED|nr:MULTISPECIES: T6SS immunity protein Tli4 family protein [Pseudomonas]MCP9731995.1 T6SS immunity protein Tli4 family protein [Pseudomonas sp. GBPI_506]MDD1945106.1 T6SS immunity protein Tli4 family protein [Pseudomonas carnis]MDO3693176.1 T6SS immunity protein Tli4 family protein [Pseudomonas sp. DKN 2791]MDO7035228.1 T6SS immunity protein Tli4 family protein [Pseudomonas sp. DKN 2792]MDW8839949.1 T6SS immunity protein Tli4 family protein [Pseudomonas carnis]
MNSAHRLSFGRLHPKASQLLFMCLTIALLTGCAAFKQPSEQEKQTVHELTSNMRTWALGRGLIDLPANWTGGGDVKLYYGLGADHSSVEVLILGERVTQERFDAALNERSRRISAVKNYKNSDVPMLVSAKFVSPRETLLQYYKQATRRQTFVHESHLLIDDVYVMLRAQSYEGDTDPVEAQLLKLSKEIFKVTPETAGAGFALGPVVIRSHHDHEIASFYFRPPASDVSLNVYYNALSPDDGERLHVRTQKDGKIFLAGDYEQLRMGQITLAGMQAEESLIGFSDDTHRQILFVSENYRDNPSRARPGMSIRLSAGGMKGEPVDPNEPEDLVRWTLPQFANKGYELPLWQQPASPEPVNPSLTDYEAMAVWDAILKSVRIRYGSVAPRPDPEANIRGPVSRRLPKANASSMNSSPALKTQAMPLGVVQREQQGCVHRV